MEKIQRYSGLIFVISVLLLLVSYVSAARYLPSDSLPTKFTPSPFHSYSVVLDAGSSSSHVYVFCFDSRLDLVIGKNQTLFEKTKPSLSAYAKDPEAAADSLLNLLREAEAVVPRDLRGKTPVRVLLTEQLEEDASDRILQAVRAFLEKKSSLKYRSDWVTVLTGNQEFAYRWMSVQYLPGDLAKEYSDADDEGFEPDADSLRMGYFISDLDALMALHLWKSLYLAKRFNGSY